MNRHFRQLPPAGNPVSFKRTDTPIGRYFPIDHTRFYSSGTASLAACIIAAKREANIQKPNVLLPAYCCPDLISATDFAGVRPVLVDFEFERPWMDLKEIQQKMDENTIAIIAVNFLGIDERIPQIRELLNDKPIVLIYDNAQCFPNIDTPYEDSFTVLSFGRGKPVGLLYGGAVISKNRSLLEKLEPSKPKKERFLTSLKHSLKTRLYNFVIKPYVYWITEYMPFLNLGKTRYHPLHHITSHPEKIVMHLPSNIECYLSRKTEILNLQSTYTGFVNNANLKALSQLSKSNEKCRLLRFPVLARNKKQRDTIYGSLIACGCGASTLYNTTIPNIDGLANRFDINESFPNAIDFSERLLTLPLHTDVSTSDINQIENILECHKNT